MEKDIPLFVTNSWETGNVQLQLRIALRSTAERKERKQEHL